MKKLRVVINEVGASTYWYHGCEGMIFEVYDHKSFRGDYTLAEDYDRGHNTMWRHIDKDECSVVEVLL